MQISRREFLQVSGSVALTGFLTSVGCGLLPIKQRARHLGKQLQSAHKSTTICPYCAVGCGAIVHARGARTINIEGDPDHPINRGSLCPKGAALSNISNNPSRCSEVLYRAPGATEWERKSWDWAFDRIAGLVKKARDATFTGVNARGQEVNRTTAIASVGSAAMDNEECWLYQRFLRTLGLVYIEHQARI